MHKNKISFSPPCMFPFSYIPADILAEIIRKGSLSGSKV